MLTLHHLTFELLVRSVVFTLLAFTVICLWLKKFPGKKTIVLFLSFAILIHLGWFLLAGPSGMERAGSLLLALRVFCATWTLSSVFIVMAGGFFVALSTALWLSRWLRTRGQEGSEEDAELFHSGRRQFLARAMPLAAVAVTGGGTLNGMKPFEVREVQISIPGLPKALDGFRIGQTTDFHVGDFIDPDHVRRAVETLNQVGVDLQVMTGDLIDDMDRIPHTFAALGQCKAQHGMLAILGNHEKYFGLTEVLQAYEKTAKEKNIHLLVDSNVVIDHQGCPLRIVGVDYPTHPGSRTALSRYQTREWMERSAKKGFQGVAKDETVICLSHHPDFFPLAAERGAKLTLAGHTHGGQVAFMGISAFSFAFPYILGRYRIQDSHLYVSGGTGHWFPIRIGVPTEVTVITLRSV